MQAIRLQKKYPDVSQDEMFDFISRFKCVRLHRGSGAINDVRAAPALSTPTSRGALTRLPCCKPFRAVANRTIVRERLSSTSQWTPVARSNWRIGSRCVRWPLSSPVSDFSSTTFHAVLIGQLNVKLRSQTSSLTTKAGKVTVQGSNANVSHTINEDERREFTNHINGVSITCFRDHTRHR